MSIYNLNPALESPPYGDKLEAGELFLDGTDSFISSDGREPVVDVVDFEPAKINVDGSEVDNDVVKWPGYRGANGFFGEYENEASETLTPSSAATISQEGDWLKLLTSTGAAAAATVSIPSSATQQYVYTLVRRGNFKSAQVRLTGGTTSGVAIDFDAQTIGVTNSTDIGSYFISSELAVVKFLSSADAANTTFTLRIPSTTTGEHAYFQNWMVVNLPYPVPYTKGVHPASKLQYDFDWASSDEWTIEGWAKLEEDPAVAFDTILVIGDTTSSNFLKIDVNTSGKVRAVSVLGGVATAAISSETVVAGVWFHFKASYSPSVKQIIINGVTNSNTTATPSTSVLAKTALFSTDSAAGTPFAGYIQDLRISPDYDTSTTHYTSGLPYYNPEKTYGQDGSWSIDKRGNVSGLFQQAGNIVEDYELSGQRVTKWDTGRMTISGSNSATTAAIGNQTIVFTFVEGFIETPFITYVLYSLSYLSTVRNTVVGAESSTACTLVYYAESATSRTYKANVTAIGRWK